MRFLIRHETTFRFEPAARFVNGLVRLTPRNHEGQFLAKWRLALDIDGRLKPSDDGFGNIVHGLALAGPVPAVTLRVEGEVGTFDTAGVVRGTLERFPAEFYLRETPLTATNATLRTFCQDSVGADQDPLARLHDVLAALHRDLAWEHETAPDPTATSAAMIFSLGSGDAAGLAHVFIACAHHLRIPARFACGYCTADEGPVATDTLHGWAEAYVAGLGWIGFDPALGRCPSETHVRVACSLDCLGTTPVRIAATGADETARNEAIHVSQAAG